MLVYGTMKLRKGGGKVKYNRIVQGRFLSRPNRFIAHVDLGGADTVVHVKNTGRCRELLVPGCTVYLEKSENPARKTAYDLIAVKKGDRLINMDSQAPNRAFGEFARNFDPKAVAVHSEYRYGDSRLDFCIETAEGLHFVEVKGVTLEENGHTRFPDAPTQRGIKHLHELERAVKEGHRATAFFVIQMDNVLDFSPNDATHGAFGDALRHAAQNGVEVVAYACFVAPDRMHIQNSVPVVL